MNQLLIDVIEAYKRFYLNDHLHKPHRTCGCGPEHGYWPNNYVMSGTFQVPAVCEACEWISKRTALQHAVVEAGLSLPIPPRNEQTRYRGKPDACHIREHPLHCDPYLWRPDTPLGDESWKVTGNVARGLSRNGSDNAKEHDLEHVVFYLSRSHIIDKVYGDRTTEVQEILRHAPVLVYWRNADQRNGTSWVDQAIMSRNIGLTFMVEE